MPPLFIADSDDEDSDGFSPVKAPDVAEARRGAANTNAPAYGPGSTDSVLFQSVYDEQNDAAHGLVRGGSRHAEAELLSVDDLASGEADHGNDTSLLTSVTDPTVVKGRGLSGKVESAWTQVTSPGRRQDDPWEVPSSPEVSVKAKKTLLARGQLDLEGDSMVGASGVSNRKTKRRRLNDPSETVAGMKDGVASAPVEESRQLAAIPEPTLPIASNSSLLISTRKLTSSQRGQYQSFSTISSDTGSSTHFSRAQQLQVPAHEGSSGSATNVNTPRSQRPSLTSKATGTQSESRSKGRQSTSSRLGHSSSPDIITVADPAGLSSQQGDEVVYTKEDEVSEVEAELDTGAGDESDFDIKTVGRKQISNEDSGSEYEAATKPQQKGKKPRGRPKKKAEEKQAARPALHEKKKRGRPRKSQPSEEQAQPVGEEEEEHDALDDQGDDDQKSIVADHVQGNGEREEEVEEAEEDDAADQQTPESPASKNRGPKGITAKAVGRSTKAAKAPPADISETDSSGPEDQQEDKPSKTTQPTTTISKAAEIKSAALTPNTGSIKGPLYRVGLSKRSRIAPLLKSLKK